MAISSQTYTDEMIQVDDLPNEFIDSSLEFINITVNDSEFQFDKTLLQDATKHIEFVIDIMSLLPLISHVTSNVDNSNKVDSNKVDNNSNKVDELEESFLKIITKYNNKVVQVDVSTDTVIGEPLSLLIKQANVPVLFVKFLYKNITKNDIHSYINQVLGCEMELYHLPSKYRV